jgi:Cu/Ag efflux protein CusF
MNRLLATLALGASLVVSAAAWAQASFVDAEVRRVDAGTGKVTLRHGEIKYLDMSPMTMVFTAKDKALVAGLKAGDKIRFKAAHEGDTYWITAIERR